MYTSKLPRAFLVTRSAGRALSNPIAICSQQRPKSTKNQQSLTEQLLDPNTILRNIVAIRTKGWSSAFSPWAQPTAKERAAADHAFQHSQMSPREVVPPNTDVVDTHPKAERKALIRQALQEGNLSFGFSAGGLLFPYLIGVLYELHALGVITSGTKLGGASAGSIIAACYHAGLSREQVIDHCLALVHDCRANGTRGRLGDTVAVAQAVLRSTLHDALPDDSHKRCSGVAHVAVTQAFPSPRSLLVSHFHDKDDLIAAVLTSCHIPWWFDTNLLTTFRGRYCYDGGLTNFIPLPANTEGVRVCCFPAGQLATMSGIAISPDAYHVWPHDLNQMLQWAFEPASEDVVHGLIEAGARDARAWAADHNLLDIAGHHHSQAVV